MENIDFVSIYRKYRSRAFNIGKFILGDEDEAEDVCQDVFETLFHMGRSVDFSDEKKLENLIVRISYHKASDHRKKAFRKYEYANSDAILEMTDMRVRKGNRVDEIVLDIKVKKPQNPVLILLVAVVALALAKREKNRTNYEIYVSVTLYDIPTRLVARHYHITENNVNNRVMRTRRWLAREYKKITR